ncbi:MAG: argininosuccinate synthase [Planctomycetota bacterium]
MQRVILAYSGGLINTAAIHWLRNKRRMRVVTLSAELGQGTDLEALAETALMNGAESAHIADLREPFLREFVFPALKAGALYEGSYMLSTALSRPLIAREMVRLAREESCEFLAHGAWGRSNDQVRYEAAVSALAPDLNIVSPRREWQFENVDQIRSYAERHGLIVNEKERTTPYTRDQNIWGCRVTGGPLEDPANPPPEDVFLLTKSPMAAPDVPVNLSLTFEAGEPVALDGVRMAPVPLIQALNRVGGENAIGRVDHLENRLLGNKIREIYEKPAAVICFAALRALEKLTLNAEALHSKPRLSDEFAELVYKGQWFSDLREALGSFFDRMLQHVSGEVRLQLYKGNVVLQGVESPWSLYQREMSTISQFDSSDQQAVAGWLKLAGSLVRHTSRVRRSQTRRPGSSAEHPAPIAEPGESDSSAPL